VSTTSNNVTLVSPPRAMLSAGMHPLGGRGGGQASRARSGDRRIRQSPLAGRFHSSASLFLAGAPASEGEGVLAHLRSVALTRVLRRKRANLGGSPGTGERRGQKVPNGCDSQEFRKRSNFLKPSCQSLPCCDHTFSETAEFGHCPNWQATVLSADCECPNCPSRRGSSLATHCRAMFLFCL